MLDKKGAIYSDRPTLQMAGELVGWRDTLVLLPYGDRFRRYRRFFHKLIGSGAAMKQFHPIEEVEARRFIRQVLEDPNKLSAHIRRYCYYSKSRSIYAHWHTSRTVGATILRITYGYEAQEFKDPFVQLADQATEQFSLATAPGGFLVDLIPACELIHSSKPEVSDQLLSKCATFLFGFQVQVFATKLLPGDQHYVTWSVGRTSLSKNKWYVHV